MAMQSQTKNNGTIKRTKLSTRALSKVDGSEKSVVAIESPSKPIRILGYARVSTSQQEIQSQIDELKKHGVTHNLIFIDKISGAKDVRPGLDACLKELRDGDVLLAWRLDRLGRSVRHLVDLVETLQKRGVGFRSICDGAIDTTSASGELVFMIFSALAQFE
jgi:DNA invertase Pin-like site-specific DNA recombinase